MPLVATSDGLLTMLSTQWFVPACLLLLHFAAQTDENAHPGMPRIWNKQTQCESYKASCSMWSSRRKPFGLWAEESLCLWAPYSQPGGRGQLIEYSFFSPEFIWCSTIPQVVGDTKMEVIMNIRIMVQKRRKVPCERMEGWCRAVSRRKKWTDRWRGSQAFSECPGDMTLCGWGCMYVCVRTHVYIYVGRQSFEN